MIRAVIFDFNGILADDDPIHMHALRGLQKRKANLQEDEYMERYLPLNDQDCFQELWRKNGTERSKQENWTN